MNTHEKKSVLMLGCQKIDPKLSGFILFPLKNDTVAPICFAFEIRRKERGRKRIQSADSKRLKNKPKQVDFSVKAVL